MNQPWTAKDREYLRQHYSQWAPEPMPTKVIAARLNRTVHQVCEAARRFGLRRPPRRRLKDYRKRLLAAQARGWSAQHIARHLGAPESTVLLWLRTLGLRPNGDDEAARRARLRANRRICQVHGFASLGEWQAQRRRLQAAQLGWPQAAHVGEAHLLSYLADRPDATRVELCSALDVLRRTLVNYLGRLCKQGLVISNRGCPARYSLAPGVQRHQPEGGRPQPTPKGEGVPQRTARFHGGA